MNQKQEQSLGRQKVLKLVRTSRHGRQLLPSPKQDLSNQDMQTTIRPLWPDRALSRRRHLRPRRKALPLSLVVQLLATKESASPVKKHGSKHNRQKRNTRPALLATKVLKRRSLREQPRPTFLRAGEPNLRRLSPRPLSQPELREHGTSNSANDRGPGYVQSVTPKSVRDTVRQASGPAKKGNVGKVTSLDNASVDPARSQRQSQQQERRYFRQRP